MNEVLLKHVQQFPRTARELILSCEGDEYIDALAEINDAEKGLGSLRRRSSKEASNGDHGTSWAIKVGRKCVRSYNNMSLIVKFADAMNVTVMQAMGQLIASKALRLSWQWTALKKEANEYNVTLAVAHHEILDGDEADVGEVWVDDYPKYERLDPEEGT